MLKPFKTIAFLLLTTAITATTHASITNLNYEVTFDSESFFFDTHVYQGTNANLHTSAPVPINPDFSTLGDTTLSLNLKSSTGRFYANFPKAGKLVLSFWTGNDISHLDGAFTDNNPLITFNDLQAAFTPTIKDPTTNVVFTGNSGDGNRFGFEIEIPENQPFSFESITFTTTVPAAYNKNFSSIITGSDPLFHGYINDTTTEHGQFLSLTPIPEPASISLLAIASLALTTRRSK
ncbi:hypothetical protein KS4_34750 [Poriferisphaera corsica]|uniref:PEP-CTERM protein-sorting domain-containing protein n=1 Tax=Poriferisphaera corsica TaxID=2528020 RepID=A0A517YYU3_9BACT|nr:PEP-CTERM sorting domain-containing protein [Poriferisphaera corsica]QDU35394.1 hypothetical protein KS4_34750 [Poriferisphaera corsica]